MCAASGRAVKSLVIGLLLVLAGCGGEARLAAPAAATPTGGDIATPTAAPLATPAPSIGEIVWATSADPVTNAPADAVASYRPDAPRIVAAMPTRGIPGEASIQATWEYNDTPLEAFTTELDRPAQLETTWISFYLDRDPESLWPEGVYAIAISLDGTEVQRSTVEVRAAE
jgi:hypothetical protein